MVMLLSTNICRNESQGLGLKQPKGRLSLHRSLLWNMVLRCPVARRYLFFWCCERKVVKEARISIIFIFGTSKSCKASLEEFVSTLC